jgi:hypothetical protein
MVSNKSLTLLTEEGKVQVFESAQDAYTYLVDNREGAPAIGVEWFSEMLAGKKGMVRLKKDRGYFVNAVITVTKESCVSESSNPRKGAWANIDGFPFVCEAVQLEDWDNDADAGSYRRLSQQEIQSERGLSFVRKMFVKAGFNL